MRRPTVAALRTSQSVIGNLGAAFGTRNDHQRTIPNGRCSRSLGASWPSHASSNPIAMSGTPKIAAFDGETKETTSAARTSKTPVTESLTRSHGVPCDLRVLERRGRDCFGISSAPLLWSSPTIACTRWAHSSRRSVAVTSLEYSSRSSRVDLDGSSELTKCGPTFDPIGARTSSNKSKHQLSRAVAWKNGEARFATLPAIR
jgi:hypothetical protein